MSHFADDSAPTQPAKGGGVLDLWADYIERPISGAATREDYRAILDLLAAFGISGKHATSVTIHAAVGEATTVEITRPVSPSAVSRSLVQRTYEVTAKDIGTL